MGSSIQDLKLKLDASYMIQPSEPTERRSMFLSNIDQGFNLHVKGVVFFHENPGRAVLRSTESMIEKTRQAFGKLLVPYDFLSGRMKVNEETGRLEIDCNCAGISLVIASSELMLEELGELGPNNPANKKLVPMPELEDQLKDQPLFAIQGTSFRCGSIAIGLSSNHAALDGTSTLFLLLNLISLISDQPLPYPPFKDRSILAARSHPRITYPHPHLITLDNIRRLPISTTRATTNLNHIELQFKEFHLNANNISFLKSKAEGLIPKSSVTTTFTVITAHLWRSKALATNKVETTSTLTYAVDLRRSAQNLVPLSYAGCAILTAYASATCQELEVGPFSRIVEMVAEGKDRILNDEEYVRSVLDCGLENGFPAGDVSVTSWLGLGFGDLELEWLGKIKKLCYLPIIGSDIIILYPGDEEGSVTALVGLSSDCMGKFHDRFYAPFTPQHHA